MSELSNYNFVVKYRPGKVHTDVDVLSKLILDESKIYQKYSETTSPAEFNMLYKSLKQNWISSITVDPVGYEKKLGDCLNFDNLQQFSQSEIALAQLDVLYRNCGLRKQIVLPKKFRSTVLQELHNNMGHVCVERTANLIRDRFYWPKMLSDIELHLKSCQCLKSKIPNRKQYAPMGHLSSTAPFDMLSIDFLELDPAGGYRYALVIIDHLTRFCQIYPTRNRLAKTAADKIFSDLVLRFGFPTRIHHDQGPEFESQLMRQLHKLGGVKMSHTTLIILWEMDKWKD